jgi:hypothetical protein
MQDNAEKIIKIIEERNEFITCMDGYIYYWPNGFPYGHLSSAQLRIIADELDRRNKPWDDKVNEYFSTH